MIFVFKKSQIIILHSKSFLVTKSFETDVETIGPIRLLGDGSLVFSGEKQGQEKLKKYNLHTGTEMNSVNFAEACGLCPVELCGVSSLAVSFL